MAYSLLVCVNCLKTIGHGNATCNEQSLVWWAGFFLRGKGERLQSTSMMTLRDLVSAACAKVSYASRISSNLKRCVMSNLASILLAFSDLSSIGMLTVSTRRVVMEILRSQSFSKCKATGTP